MWNDILSFIWSSLAYNWKKIEYLLQLDICILWFIWNMVSTRLCVYVILGLFFFGGGQFWITRCYTKSSVAQHGSQTKVKIGPGPIFTKLRRRKHNRRAFVCFKIGEVTIEQSALPDSTWEVYLIYDVFALLLSTTPQVNACNVWIYVNVHAYEH
jgi:hypothetical protein